MQVRELQKDDVDEVIGLHLATWPPTELSVQLGANFLRMFFAAMVGSPHGRAYVALSGTKILGYVCAFSEYGDFNAALKAQYTLPLALTTLGAVWAGRLPLRDLWAGLRDGAKVKRVHQPEFHLGAFAIRRGMEQAESPQAIAETLIPEALEYLRRRGGRWAWASSDARNLPAHLLMNRFGFRSTASIPYGSRKLVVFECDLEN